MKRLAIWGLFFVIGALAFALGYLTHRNALIPETWRTNIRRAAAPAKGTVLSPSTRPHHGDAFPLQIRSQPSLSPEDRAAILSIGYLQGSQPASAASGVTTHDRERAWNGLNLFTSGHAPEAALMDMDGRTLHSWRCDFATAWPNYKEPSHVRKAATRYWRRAYLYPNGDLLAIFEGVGILKLDKDSHLLWTYRGGCHHDLFVDASGAIYVLSSELRTVPWIARDKPVIDNSIVVLDAQGQEQRRVSVLDCLSNSPYAPLLEWLPKEGDVLHVNTVEVLDGSHADLGPAFQAGRVLISILTLNTVAIVDMNRQTLSWALTGLWKAQHQPTLLENGDLLVFDNRGAGKQSRVLEINPQTQALVWEYPSKDSPPFYSEWCGSAQRLPNGNTLISETDNGRAFEVTPDHQIVWEFINPNQFVEQNVTMVAALPELVRLPEDYCAQFLPTETGTPH